MGLGKDIHLLVKEIPVEYKAVSKLLPSLWNQYQPEVGAVNIALVCALFYNWNLCTVSNTNNNIVIKQWNILNDGNILIFLFLFCQKVGCPCWCLRHGHLCHP